MEQICPFCGGELNGAPAGETPGTRRCPGCGQEVDQPAPAAPETPPPAEAPERAAPTAEVPPLDPAAGPIPVTAPPEEPASVTPAAPAPAAETGADTEAAPEAVYDAGPDSGYEDDPGPQAQAGAATPPPPGPYATPAQGADARAADAYVARRPAAEEEPSPDAPAWEGEGGLLTRMWRTIWQVMLHPARTFTPAGRPGLSWSFSFGLILGTLGTAAQIFWSHAMGEPSAAGSPVWSLIAAPLGAALAMFLVAAVVHLFLIIFGARSRPYTATFRVLAYGQALGILYLVPQAGAVVAFFWGIVVMVGGLAAAHRASRARVFWALFIPLIVLLVLVSALVIGVAGLGAFMAAISMTQGQGTAL